MSCSQMPFSWCLQANSTSTHPHKALSSPFLGPWTWKISIMDHTSLWTLELRCSCHHRAMMVFIGKYLTFQQASRKYEVFGHTTRMPCLLWKNQQCVTSSGGANTGSLNIYCHLQNCWDYMPFWAFFRKTIVAHWISFRLTCCKDENSSIPSCKGNPSKI